jgi:hypothetical protein
MALWHINKCVFVLNNIIQPGFILPVVEAHEYRRKRECDIFLEFEKRGTSSREFVFVYKNAGKLKTNPEIRLRIVHFKVVFNELKQMLKPSLHHCWICW